jgi:23S rRNA pseudouridine1911/1915/1917 synthase
MTRLRHSESTFVRPLAVPEGSIVSVFRVPPEVAGQRLDVFLQSQLRRTSRTRTQMILRGSAYDPDGRPLRKNDRVRAEQHILLWRPPWDEDPVPTDIPILYEDDHLLVVDKPAHLPVHPTARYFKNTLIRLLLDARPGAFLSLVHRIDRETSGVLIVAKSAAADRHVKRQLELRDGVEKSYGAITWGVPKEPSRSPPPEIGGRSGGGPREAGTTGEEPRETSARFRYAQSLELDPDNPIKVKMRIGQLPDAMHAATWFEVKETRTRDGRDYAKVVCDLETGRQHQIRVHLATLGTPIVGDKLYGPDEGCFTRNADNELTADDLALLELPRHALHARRIAFAHPATGERLEVTAPWPAEIEAFWAGLDPVG